MGILISIFWSKFNEYISLLPQIFTVGSIAINNDVIKLSTTSEGEDNFYEANLTEEAGQAEGNNGKLIFLANFM